MDRPDKEGIVKIVDVGRSFVRIKGTKGFP